MVGVAAGNPLQQFAVSRLARREHLSGSDLEIEPQLALAGVLIRAMTLETRVRENRANVPHEVHRLVGRNGHRGRSQHEKDCRSGQR